MLDRSCEGRSQRCNKVSNPQGVKTGEDLLFQNTAMVLENVKKLYYMHKCEGALNTIITAVVLIVTQHAFYLIAPWEKRCQLWIDTDATSQSMSVCDHKTAAVMHYRYSMAHQLSCFCAQLSKLSLVMSLQPRLLLLDVSVLLPLEVVSIPGEALCQSLLLSTHCRHPLTQAPATCPAECASLGGWGWQRGPRGGG